MDALSDSVRRQNAACHAVQFYDSDAALIDEVSGFIGEGLEGGGVGLVIATPIHRNSLLERLPAIGGADAQRCTLLDARETLSSLLVDGWPEQERFNQIIGGAVERACRQSTGRVHAFGEMVALLAEEGNTQAALRLEQLWNDLARRHSFSLLCAYPLRLFAGAEHEPAFHQVCDAHTHLSPHVHAPADPHSFDRRIAALRQKAAALETELARRQSLEAQLRTRERELSDFLESAVEGIHRVGADGTVLWANRAELELLGYTQGEFIGRDIRDFHADRELGEDLLARLRRGETVRGYPARLRCKDGSIRHVLIDSNALFENGRFVHTRCFTRDVTERVRLQEALEHKVAQLATADRRKDDFLAILGHELRNPLAPIGNAVEVLKRLPSDPGGVLPQVRAIIERQVGLMARLVDDLLDVARISSGKMQLQLGEHRLADTVQRAVELARPLLEERGHRLQVDLPPGDVVVRSDQARMAQAIANLLNNAAKYTPADGRIALAAAVAGDQLVLSISDNGVGLTPELRARMFEPFIQGDLDASRGGGLGVGLALVRSIAQLHGGSIEAHSDGPGCGSRFVLTVPLRAGAAPAELAEVRFGSEPAEPQARSSTGFKANPVSAQASPTTG